jgi:hypothetical protein
VRPSFSDASSPKPMNPNCVMAMSSWDMGPNPALRALRAAVQWRVLTPNRDLWALKQKCHSAHCNSLHAKHKILAAKLAGRF